MTTTTQGCPYCGHTNPAQYTFCGGCGRIFAEANRDRLKTGRLGNRDDGQRLYTITFAAEGKQHTFDLRPGERVLLGREVEFMLHSPDIDLGQFDSEGRTVSRIHALMDCTVDGLQLTDLDSANGTVVNGARLAPFETHAIQDGDQLRFGNLVAHLTVKTQHERPRYVPRLALALAK
jgi:pSer/pThr/pTyr-binding forkhead associated (FHA) protein